MINDSWWLRIMGIGASTNVKEIRIDQTNYPTTSGSSVTASASGRRSARGLGSLGRRWINSAENAANNRRTQQLSGALESAEKRAQDSEQRVRQLERELATIELRNVELAEESIWLKKQLSDRPEVPLSERPPTGSRKLTTGGQQVATASGGSSADTTTETAYRQKQSQYVAKLESQIKLYEEDILKLKTKMNKETQRLQAELDDQKHRSEKEVRSLDNRLIEAHKLNQKYEEVIGSKLSSETVAQIRSEVLADSSMGTSASTVRAASSTTMSNPSGGGDPLSQSKSRAQLILELTEQISAQQDKIRYLEDEIVQRDIELARMKSIVQKTDEVINMSASMRKQSTRRSSAVSTSRPPRTTETSLSGGGSRSRTAVQAEAAISGSPSIVANEDEIEALLNNPAMLYGQDEEEEEKSPRKAEVVQEDVSQDLQHQQQLNMSASLCSVPASWRKEPQGSSAPTTSTSSALPPTGANHPKRLISVVNTIDGNNLGGKIGQLSGRPKTTTTTARRRPSSPMLRQQTLDEPLAGGGTELEETGGDGSQKLIRHQVSVDQSATSPSGSTGGLGTRTHSAPMFSFKPRPSSKQSGTRRTALRTAASITGSELPPPIDLEEEVVEHQTRGEQQKKPSSLPVTRDGKKQPPPPPGALSASASAGRRRRNSDAIEVLSLHEQEAESGAAGASGATGGGGYDSPNAPYDDEGDIEDGGEEDDEGDSDQEIRRRFEERWKKSTAVELEPEELDEPMVAITTTSASAATRPPKVPRPPAGGGVGRAASSTSSGGASASAGTSDPAQHQQQQRPRVTTSAKSQDSGFLGDSCASTNSLGQWKGRTKRQMSVQPQPYDPLDVDKLLEM